MEINREKLLADLEMVKAGLSPREFIEQSSCFVFQDGHVMTFNDEVACRKKVGLNITGAIQAASLLDILGKLDDPDLMVEENNEGELEFKGKRKMFGLTKDAEVFLPIDRVEVPEKWRPLDKEFTAGVGMVQHCVSRDESRFILTCIHLHPEYVEACDNLQIMRFPLKTGLKEPVLVRGSSLAHITSMGMDHIALTKSWIHFKNQDGLVLSCRRYADDYPSLGKMIAFDGHPIVIPKGLKAASERAGVFASDKAGDPMVNVKIAEGVLRVTGEGLSGWYREKKKVVYDGPPVDFYIAPELLAKISDEYSNAVIAEGRLKVAGGKDGEGWQYVTVLGGKPEEPTEEEEKDFKKKKKEKETGKDES